MKSTLTVALMVGFVLAVLWWQPFISPADFKLVADKLFSATLSKKDNAFSKVLSKDDKEFARVLKPKAFVFPQDHGPHNAYRSEWWYFTGNLKNPQGRQFGYELTFFRFALKSPMLESKSVWRSNQMYMAHLTLTDVENNRFYTDERISRAGNDLAGAANNRFQVWLYDWSVRTEGKADFPLRMRANTDQFAIDLLLTPQKRYVLQGNEGLSQKSREPGNASYYYSYPRLDTKGILSVADKSFSVAGVSWMDREWSTSALSEEQSGWDWFALQLSDNTELMYYQLRRKDGQPDMKSAGSYILSDNSKISLNQQQVKIHSKDHWKSPHSKIIYPSQWRMEIPVLGLELEVVPLISDQELNVSYRYWEGAVRVTGTKNGKPVSGQGYVELAGYN
jgi:predicted secreted hydrolase